MPMFVHLTPERNVKAILRSGITRLRKDDWRPGGNVMPLTRNFYVSHQWLRELKRGRQRTICAVYFRIPDDEQLWVGHYNQNHHPVSAAEAATLIGRSENREGQRSHYPAQDLEK